MGLCFSFFVVMVDPQTCLRFYSSTRAGKWVEPDEVGKEARQSFEERPFPRTLWSGAPKGRDISAQGKRSAALGVRPHESQALKGRNNRNVPTVAIFGQEPLVPPFQGFPLTNNDTQGGAWRLTPPRLPWADMLRPFGARSSRLFGARSSRLFGARSSRLFGGKIVVTLRAKIINSQPSSPSALPQSKPRRGGWSGRAPAPERRPH